MHKPESIVEKEMFKIGGEFEVQTDHWIQVRRRDLVLINKKEKNLSTEGFFLFQQIPKWK